MKSQDDAKHKVSLSLTSGAENTEASTGFRHGYAERGSATVQRDLPGPSKPCASPQATSATGFRTSVTARLSQDAPLFTEADRSIRGRPTDDKPIQIPQSPLTLRQELDTHQTCIDARSSRQRTFNDEIETAFTQINSVSDGLTQACDVQRSSKDYMLTKLDQTAIASVSIEHRLAELKEKITNEVSELEKKITIQQATNIPPQPLAGMIAPPGFEHPVPPGTSRRPDAHQPLPEAQPQTHGAPQPAQQGSSLMPGLQHQRRGPPGGTAPQQKGTGFWREQGGKAAQHFAIHGRQNSPEIVRDLGPRFAQCAAQPSPQHPAAHGSAGFGAATSPPRRSIHVAYGSGHP